MKSIIKGLVLSSGLLCATAIAHAGELDIQANDVRFDADQQSYFADGTVEISRDGRVLLADRVRYNQSNGMIYASGDVQLLTADGTIFYADEMQVDETLTREHAENFRAETPNNVRIAASTLQKDDAKSRNFSNFVYTPCIRCEADPESPPVWQIKASEAEHDLENRDYVMRNAFVEIGGVPILYTPYFSHPDSTVQRRSGFLAPTYGSSDELGHYLVAPYFMDLDLDKNLLLIPTVMQKSGPILAAEYKQAFDIGTLTADVSVGQIDLGKGDGKQKAGHYNFTLALRPESNVELGGNLRHTSNPGYLEKLPVKSSNFGTLYESNAYWRKYGLTNPRNRIEATVVSYKDHRTSLTVDEAPFLVPEVKGQYYAEVDQMGGRFKYNYAARHIQQPNIANSQNITVGAEYNIGNILPMGIVADYTASIEASHFRYKSENDNLSSGSTTQLYPRLHGNWRLPFHNNFGDSTGILEPIASFNLSPANVNSTNLPNQDAGVLVSNESLLSSSEIISGLTRRDDSTRLGLAAEYTQIWQTGTLASLLIGRNFELKGTSLSDEDSHLRRFESRDNDYIMRTRLNHINGFNIEDRITIDNENGNHLNSHEIETSWSNLAYGFSPTFDYTYQRDDEKHGLRGKHQFNAGFHQKIGTYWAFSGKTNYDLNNNQQKFRTGQLRLAYEDECLKIIAHYKRDMNETRYTTKENIWGLSLELKFGG